MTTITADKTYEYTKSSLNINGAYIVQQIAVEIIYHVFWQMPQLIKTAVMTVSHTELTNGKESPSPFA